MAEPSDGVAFDEALRHSTPITGCWRDAFHDVRKKVSRLVNGSDEFVVGFTLNGERGVRARWNAKYKRLDMTDIAVVYTTDRQRFRHEIERDLLEYYEHAERAACPDCVGECQLHVYVAWRRS